jgi:GntR family transcriptional repressor for pyruvate dehydrogenase complex
MNERNPQPRSRSRSLAHQVMNDLVERIRRGDFQPGDRLPTEPELMAEQGVSRTVVREAMSRLQAAGYAETRHGVGTFVLAGGGRAPELDMSTVTTIRDTLAMLELRISLESEAAALAALRRTDEQLAAMRRALAQFEDEANKGGAAVEADFQFHLQIALATGNHFFEEIFRHLGKSTIPRTRLDTSRFATEPGRAYLLGVNREHQAIYEAIARRDPQAAGAGMRTHLSNSRERLRRASGLEIAG